MRKCFRLIAALSVLSAGLVAWGNPVPRPPRPDPPPTTDPTSKPSNAGPGASAAGLAAGIGASALLVCGGLYVARRSLRE
jgi:hypothetical protein